MTDQVLQMRRRRRILLACVVVLSLVLAACGSDDEDGSAESETTTTEAASSGSTTTAAEASPSTVEVEHSYGTTEVPVKPEKIASLDLQWTDVLIALGSPPDAYIPDPNVPDGFPWREGELDDSEAMTASVASGLPYEKIAARRPDLIVVTYYVTSQADYDKLSKIGSTIAGLSGGDKVDTWQDITEVAGRVLNEPDKATALIEDVDGQVEQVAEDLPGLEGKTVAMANYVPGDAIYVVSAPDDGANVLFSQLGMKLPESIENTQDSGSGRVKISLENISMLDDADMLVLFTNGEDPSGIPGYDSLAAVESGAVANLDYADVSALNTPTPLSIPYVLDKIRPALEAAAEG